VTCAIVAVAFAFSGVGMGAVKQQFFPTSDRPEVLVEVRLPEGTSIETTTAAVEKLERCYATNWRQRSSTSYVGQGARGSSWRCRPSLPDPAFAKIVVLTPDAEAREHLKQRLRQAVARDSRPRLMYASHSRLRSPLGLPGRVPDHGDQIPRNSTPSPKRRSTSCGACPTCGRQTATGENRTPVLRFVPDRIG